MSRQAVGKVVRQLPGRSHQDEELLKRIQATVTQVQGDYWKLNSVTGNLLNDRHQKEKDMEALFRSLERLEKEKANKEDLVLGVDVKADKTALFCMCLAWGHPGLGAHCAQPGHSCGRGMCLPLGAEGPNSLLQAMLRHLGLQDLPALGRGHSPTPLLGRDQPPEAPPREEGGQGGGPATGSLTPAKDPLQGTVSTPQDASVAADRGQDEDKDRREREQHLQVAISKSWVQYSTRCPRLQQPEEGRFGILPSLMSDTRDCQPPSVALSDTPSIHPSLLRTTLT
ncbi:uncharacterized protein LOC141932954 [Strix aluco]|uniref:uncharacterized protein LOC141932954 n=1 Tax=Strix aluco TaxID=111821 RepID=UPI003DA5CDE9